MKFAYLLQTVRRVPLEYQFRLYNYGPYDSAVLSDVSQAVSFKAIKSETFGFGYAYSPIAEGHEELCQDATIDDAHTLLRTDRAEVLCAVWAA